MFSLLQIIAILLTATAAFAWVNYALLKLPNTIGLLIMGLLASLLLVGLDAAFPSVELFHRLIETVQDIDFSKTLLDGMLAFLLFAGALHVDFSRLRGRGLIIGIMATIGVVISTAVVAGGVWWVSRAIGSPLPFAWALVFGALISPTDPVAVLNTLKNMAVPETLETDMVGESLFNDGVGVVLFAILLAAAGGSAGVDLPHIAHLFFAAAAVPLVLLARLFAVALPAVTLGALIAFVRGTIPVLTWGGIRGGISIALALSLPEVPERAPILAATYAVAIFSIVFQGLTLSAVLRRTTGSP